jgi:hypothetical protein
MTQRNTPARKTMLAKRRANQLSRDSGFTEVFSKRKGFGTRGNIDRSLIKLDGERYHSTKGKRPLTAYEKLNERAA